MKTDQQVIDDCNELASKFCDVFGYEVDGEHEFHLSPNPQMAMMWDLAVTAYEFIEGTDVENALDELEEV